MIIILLVIVWLAAIVCWWDPEVKLWERLVLFIVACVVSYYANVLEQNSPEKKYKFHEISVDL